MTTRPIIEIVEDDRIVAQSLSALLDGFGYESVHFDSAEAFLAAPSHQAVCVLLDVNMPGMNGLEVLSAYGATDAAVPMIVMTGHGDAAMAVDAMRRGASDFIEKPYESGDLITRIENVRHQAKPDQQEALLADKFAQLTKRETEVMLAVVEGAANKVIAHQLGLSPKTVEIHRSRVMDKTGAKSLSHLVRMAVKAGFDPD